MLKKEDLLTSVIHLISLNEMGYKFAWPSHPNYVENTSLNTIKEKINRSFDFDTIKGSIAEHSP